MKKRKYTNNPIVRKNELDLVKKNISSYLVDEYPKWLINNPDWFIDLIKTEIKKEISKNLKVSLSGYSTINVELKYGGFTISTASKYHPRG